MIDIEVLGALEQSLGYQFRDRELLKRALTHRSLVNEANLADVDSNERLEFLGDAALGIVVSEHLYQRFPQSLEGELSARKAALVNLDSLAERAEAVGLAGYIAVGGGEILAHPRSRRTVLGRSFEAVLGAVFLDGGVEAVRSLLTPWLNARAGGQEIVFLSADSKSELQIAVQGRFGKTPEYRLVQSEGPDHEKWFTVEVLVEGRPVATGQGSSVQRAEQQAAGGALEVLRRESGSAELGG